MFVFGFNIDLKPHSGTKPKANHLYLLTSLCVVSHLYCIKGAHKAIFHYVPL